MSDVTSILVHVSVAVGSLLRRRRAFFPSFNNASASTFSAERPDPEYALRGDRSDITSSGGAGAASAIRSADGRCTASRARSAAIRISGSRKDVEASSTSSSVTASHSSATDQRRRHPLEDLPKLVQRHRRHSPRFFGLPCPPDEEQAVPNQLRASGPRTPPEQLLLHIAGDRAAAEAGLLLQLRDRISSALAWSSALVIYWVLVLTDCSTTRYWFTTGHYCQHNRRRKLEHVKTPETNRRPRATYYPSARRPAV